MSLTELLITVTLIAILAGIAVPNFRDLLPFSRASVAEDTVALMNRAVLHFNESNWELALAAQPETPDDELAILRTLQWRSDTDPAPGSPYLQGTFPSATTADPQRYRIRWNGRMFELLTPGMDGAGIEAGFANASATPYDYPDDYKPVGAP